MGSSSERKAHELKAYASPAASGAGKTGLQAACPIRLELRSPGAQLPGL